MWGLASFHQTSALVETLQWCSRSASLHQRPANQHVLHCLLNNRPRLQEICQHISCDHLCCVHTCLSTRLSDRFVRSFTASVYPMISPICSMCHSPVLTIIASGCSPAKVLHAITTCLHESLSENEIGYNHSIRIAGNIIVHACIGGSILISTKQEVLT